MKHHLLSLLIIATMLLGSFTVIQAQTTETFEPATGGNTTFTSNSVPFTIEGGATIVDAVGFGYLSSNKYIDNWSVAVSSVKIKSTSSFSLKSLYLYPSVYAEGNINQTVGVSVTFTGKLAGITKYTYTPPSSDFTAAIWSNPINRGFSLVNFATPGYDNIPIDELVVTLGGGAVYCAIDNFTWGKTTSIPTVTSISPVSGPVGTTVTINGSGFSTTPADNTVWFGAVKATVNSSTATKITITVPAGAGSVVPVSVRVGGLAAYSNTSTTPVFTLTNTPNIIPGFIRSNITTGEFTYWITNQDLNNDGYSDLVVTLMNSNNIGILLGDGSGGFGTLTKYPVNTFPYSAAIDDFNSDGKKDLAVACNGTDFISILLGNGDGSFGSMTNFAAGTGPQKVVSGDFNGDGKSDLATTNFITNQITILLGNGAGSFGAATSYTLGGSPLAIAIGDFNKDGIADLCTANNNTSGTISVLLGNGNGTFGAVTAYSAGNYPHDIVIYDFNGDGNLDLACGNAGSTSKNISVYPGNGNGSFGAATDYALDAGPFSLGIADFNGDGKADLASANINDGNVSYMLGNGAGAFGTVTKILLASPNALTIGDFNGDGKADMATADYTANNISVLLNANLNSAPTDIALSASAFNENVAANSTVGTLSTTDPDAGNTFTYTLVAGTGSADNASFNISGGSLRITISPDFETKSSYSVRIRTTDQGSLYYEKAFSITINNVNEAPTDIALSASSINENVAANTTIGTLSSTDPDAGNTFTYTLVAGTGSADNASFNISGGSLRITSSPDFETKSSYSVRVRTTDQGSLYFEKAFTVTINDISEAPLATTNAAGSITSTGATLNGSISANNASTAVTFEYGLTTSYGSTVTADQSPVTGISATSVSKAITGLTPGTLYHYRVVGVNAGGTTNGADQSFLTASPMVLTFNTAKGTGTSVTLPLRGAVNVIVDWGDGTTPVAYNSDGDKTYTYSTGGTYTVSITGSLSQYGSGPYAGANADKLVSVSSFGNLGITSLYGAFNNAINLTAVPASLPSGVTSLSYMFCNAKSFNQDISTWNVSTVTDMSDMFENAKLFNQNIGNWDVSKVTDMSWMFMGASVFDQNIGSWDVSKVTNMSVMFASSAFNSDISNWNVSSVTNMNGMFSEAKNFNQDISFKPGTGAWNTHNVTNMGFMFRGATNFNQNIGNWDVSSVTLFSGMFNNASYFNQDLSLWNVANATTMSAMFSWATSFNQNLGTWKVGNVTDMGSMFYAVTLSAANYNSLLTGWAALTLKPNVTFHAGFSKYNYRAPAAARAVLTGSPNNWTITDGGAIPELPVVTTQAVSGISTVTATGNGNITSLGIPNPTSYGVCWNTTGTPTISNSKVDNGAASATGAFTASLTSLSANTTYYVRAFATNITGTSYGSEVSFTTLPLAATVTTQAVSSITPTTATGNGNITSLGVPNPTQYGVVWSTSTSPTVALTTKTAQGAIGVTGAFTSSITGLNENTTYYVKTYATNTAGTSYGNEVSFTTPLSCVNPATGGSITADQNGCTPFNPDAVTSVSLPTGHTGTLEYQWQSSTTGSSSGFTIIPSSNSVSYDPAALTQTTWYKRLARVTCKGDWNGAAESNVIKVTVNPLPVPAITGPVSACASSSDNIYSTEAGMTGYSWSVSAGGTISDGDGTNTITVDWNTVGDQTVSVNYENTSNCMAASSTVYPVTVSPVATVNTVDNQVLCSGSSTSPIGFSGSVSGSVFEWTNDNASIGLAGSGLGDIPSFVATNTGTAPVTATITVKPASTEKASTVFDYTGAVQTWTVPAGVTSIDIEAYGARGGSGAAGGNASTGGSGGKGTKATGTLSVVPGQVLNIYIGGRGNTPTAGFNGGGNGGTTDAGGGGGASDIRYPGNSVNDRLIVAAGGGGGGRGGCEPAVTYGGAGGDGDMNGTNGASATTPGGYAGGGFAGIGKTGGLKGIGCPSYSGLDGINGILGLGGDGGNGQDCCCPGAPSQPGGGGGGGGYFGGGGGGGGSAGTVDCSGNDKGGGGGGAGGTSFIGGVTNGTITTGVPTGDGMIVISYQVAKCAGPETTFTITVNPTPAEPIAQNNTHTYTGTEYTASTNVGANETIDWYSELKGGNSVSAPSGTDAGTYSAYAEARNLITGCVSASRTLVTLEITKVMLTVTADAQIKVYGEANPELTFQYSGFVNGDKENVLDTKPVTNTAVSIATKVGTYVDDITLSGGFDNNYDFTYVANKFDVTKAMLTVTADAQTKVYGEVNPALTFKYSGFVNGEDENVLDTKPVAATTVDLATAVGTFPDAITVSAGDDNNYDFTYVANKFDVTKAMLTISGAMVENKVYDGNTNAVITGATLSGVAGTDDVVLGNHTSGTFAQAGIGTSIGVTAAMTISGAAINNYTLIQPAGLKADITVKELLVNGAVATDKVYDGTAISAITGATLEGVVGTEDVVLSDATTGTFAQANIGTDIKVTPAMTITGTDIANYTLAQPTGLKANITAKQLTVSNPVVITNKMVDGNTVAAITSPGTLQGVVAPDLDNVAFSASADYADANVGVNKTITVVYTLSGSAMGNYIAPANLVITGAKISDHVTLSPVITATPGCEGSDMNLAYTILSGSSTEYRITFNAAALEAGFQNISYTSLPTSTGSGVIPIPIPDGTPEGVYQGTLLVRNELGVESPAYSFQFSVRLSSDYIIAKFTDVVLCDNSSKRFTAYQWYKDGIKIDGATKQFYCDPKGLVGAYSLEVKTTDGQTLVSCARDLNIPSPKKVEAYPNPMKSQEVCTVKVQGFTDEELQNSELSVYNMQGVRVYQSKEVKLFNQMSLPAVSGIYVGHVTDHNGADYVFKIIVQQ